MLTAKQEAFCVEFVKGADASTAYRRAYQPKRASAKTIWNLASRVLKKGEVKARIAELRAPVAEAVQYDLQQAMREAEEARALAIKKGQTAAAVQATQLKAKMNGLLVEERRNLRQPLQDLTDEQLNAYSDRLADQHAAITGTSPGPAGTSTTH